MAVTLNKGERFTVQGSRSGNKDGKPWSKCTFGDSKKAISIWEKNGTAFSDGDTVVVKEIESVKRGAHKYNDKWYDDYDVTCVLEKEGQAKPTGDKLDAFTDKMASFEEIDDPDSELPF